MRIAHIGDPHITDDKRLDDQRVVFERVTRDVIAFRPDLVVIPGDLTGHTVPHRSTPREREVLFAMVRALADVAPVEIVKGNHDVWEDIAALAHLGGRWPISVRDGAGSEVIDTPAGPALVYWLAYPTAAWLLRDRPAVAAEDARVATGQALEQLLSTWRLETAHYRETEPGIPIIGMGHVMVRGSVTGGGEVLVGAEIEVPADAVAGIFDYFALNHLHERQEVAPGVWYAGSVTRSDFGDVGRHKVWLDVGVADNGEGWGNAVGFSPLCVVNEHSTHAIDFGTIDYEWAADALTETGRKGRADPGCEVKLRVKVRADEREAMEPAWRALCAEWRERAHRLTVEVETIPVHRVRAPGLAKADTLAERIGVWAETIDPPVPPDHVASAVARLEEVTPAG